MSASISRLDRGVYAATTIIATLLLFRAGFAPALPADPDRRAAVVERGMSDEERLSLLRGLAAVTLPGISAAALPPGIVPMAGYVSGIPRLGIPDLKETDGGLGVANIPDIMRKDDSATAFASTLALGASFDRVLAYQVGAAMAKEAREKGFNVLLAGGVNLTRDPRAGRNAEYLSEDPLLSGYLGGDLIRGIQDQGVISTIKHFAAHDQASQSPSFDVKIDERTLRESDLLAFELAIDIGQPGSVMCAYNEVNGEYACGNHFLLDTVLKKEWHFPGWVMSDWGAVHSDSYIDAGLDQQSGAQADERAWFDDGLKARLAAGSLSRDRLSDAVRRILRTMYKLELDKPRADSPIDVEKNLSVAETEAAEGIVLLKNDRQTLPLGPETKRVLVVGGNAQIGVLSQGGWTFVEPVGHGTFQVPSDSPEHIDERQIYLMPSPLRALANALPAAKVDYDSGYDTAEAAARARSADAVIIFATKWQTQTRDASSLALPGDQDRLIDEVARANQRTVVIVESGNPVLMPWLSQSAAVLEAWYPGQRGASAIAQVLVGAINPSGRLPMTFPAKDQLGYEPMLVPSEKGDMVVIPYAQGSGTGEEAHAVSARDEILFPFGFGLSYTRFRSTGLTLKIHDRRLEAQARVENIGSRRGSEVVQVYVVSAPDQPVRRLAGFARVELNPGESRTISIPIETRSVARWHRDWAVAAGEYGFAMGTDAQNTGAPVVIALKQRSLKLN